MAAKKPVLTIPTGPRMVKGLRALADSLEGQQLSPLQFGDAEYAKSKMLDQFGLEWAHAVPTDRVGKFVGKQGSQLNTFAGVGLPSLRKTPIDLTTLIRECFDLIQSNRKLLDWSRAGNDLSAVLGELDQLRKDRDSLVEQIDRFESNNDCDLFDDDEEGSAPTSQMDVAKLRKLEAMAASTELKLREKAGELVRAADVEPILITVAERFASASETIGRQYGPEAQKIVIAAIDATERKLAELRRTLHTSEAE